MFVGNRRAIIPDKAVAGNFGMANPEGYRKALRLMKSAEKVLESR